MADVFVESSATTPTVSAVVSPATAEAVVESPQVQASLAEYDTGAEEEKIFSANEVREIIRESTESTVRTIMNEFLEKGLLKGKVGKDGEDGKDGKNASVPTINEGQISTWQDIISDKKNIGIKKMFDDTLFGGGYAGEKTLLQGKNGLSIFSALMAEMQFGLHSVGSLEKTVALYGGQVPDESDLNTARLFEVGILGDTDWRLDDRGNGRNFFGVPTEMMSGGDMYFELKHQNQKTKSLLILTGSGDILSPLGEVYGKSELGL